MVAGQWGEQPSPPPLGQYTLRANCGNDKRYIRVAATVGMVAEVPHTVDFGEQSFRCMLGLGGGRRLVLVVQALLSPEETGPVKQMQLADATNAPAPRSRTSSTLRRSGRGGHLQPVGARSGSGPPVPAGTAYLGVTNASVAVPEGAIKVVRGTEAWWKARQTSRYVIVNEWLTRPGMGERHAREP